LDATSQIAFPEDITTAVYDTNLYSSRGQNTSVAGNAADMVFGSPSGDLQYELCAIEPDQTIGGYDATLNVGIAA
jgi:hypothetical protein